ARELERAPPPLGHRRRGERQKPSRPVLAEWVTSPDNPYFARAAVNRFWSLFFGKGLAPPVDDPADANPPSRPEVVHVLADEFRASNYDIKHLIRCVVHTRAYQRGS